MVYDVTAEDLEGCVGEPDLMEFGRSLSTVATRSRISCVLAIAIVLAASALAGTDGRIEDDQNLVGEGTLVEASAILARMTVRGRHESVGGAVDEVWSRVNSAILPRL